MDNFENLQTNNEKQHYIPMEVTAETIKDFGINPADVVWARIGNKPKRVVMIPVTEEQYYEYMRPLWREDKRQQRQEPMASLDKMYEETEYEAADSDSDLEADIMKKLMIDELHKALYELEEIDPNLALGGGYDENGEMDIKQINSPYLLNYAIKAIQELSAKVDEQEKRIKELERRLQ